MAIFQLAQGFGATSRRFLATTLAGCVLAAATVLSQAQTTVQVDSTKPWAGYMNVYNIFNGGQGGYLWGSGWGLGALTAFFNSTNSVTLMPNTNLWNVLDPYWVDTNTVPFSGAKWLEANFYVDVGTAYAGQTVTFTGTVLSNNLASPYYSMAVIKEFAPGYAWIGMSAVLLDPGADFLVQRNIGAGNICQYGFMTLGPDADPATVADLGRVDIAVNNQDPSVAPMASQTAVEGQNATFTVTAQGTAPLHYEWTQTTPTATNVLVDGGRISGATTNRLTIASVVPSDAGNYTVTVWNTKGTNFATASLTLIPVAQAQTNLLLDPSFENGAFGSSPQTGWYPFNGSVLQSTNNFYLGGVTPVSVFDGTNCLELYGTGANSYNGAYQDRPALPGQVYTANAWFLTPVEDPMTGNNVCYLEVQFRDAANGVLVQYSSALVNSNSPTSTWFNLTPTNIHAGDFVTPLGTAPYLVAPPGTATVRYQFTYHAVDGTGAVYVDTASLKLREPVVTATVTGGQVRLSFPTLYAVSYQLYGKENLTDPGWHALGTPITGDGTVKILTDTPPGTQRFYTVNAVYP